jgi:cysteine synthase
MEGPMFVYGPTFAEMRDPSRLPADLRRRAQAALTGAPLDPINLFNITWKLADGSVDGFAVPRELTGVEANILVMSGRHFPTGSHKVGAAYSICVEQQLAGMVEPGRHTLIWPSTGNYGIGGAWVGPRMGYRSIVVLPEEMSAERFEKIRGYGGEIIATPGCESNVKEIYDEVKRLTKNGDYRVQQQFAEFGNYRFHTGVTAAAAKELAAAHGNGRVAAFVSAMGSSGTIGAGDPLKAEQGTVIVGLEPVQCPTLYNVGYGGHRIEGIGDKHVTWIHNVMNMDLLMCIDDEDCLRGLQLVQEGAAVWSEATGAPRAAAEALVGRFGVSGICNLLGAIKTARYLGLGPDDNVVTIATDSFDRYPSVLRRLDQTNGPMTREEALRRVEVFRNAKLDFVQEGTRQNRRRWHNQKYFTWVEQQGRTVAELEALLDQDFWAAQRARIEEIDARLAQARGELAAN